MAGSAPGRGAQPDITMNITHYSKTLSAFAAAVFALALATDAQAGPGPQQVFMPVRTMKQAQSLPVGTPITFSCGNCGAAVTTTVTADRSYLTGFTCPGCKHTFHVLSPGGGGKGTEVYTLVDNDGHLAHLAAAGKR
jgi:hypothetical protein